MTISYNWLHDYLPQVIEPQRLSGILTGIGLEVESLQKHESIKGGLSGLIIGEVIECQRHPNADKLSLTKVDIGNSKPLQIVCGAPNVEKGQKVVVASPGVTIYPLNGEPATMRIAMIRGIESHGMICAEDEIGLGSNHEGIIIIPGDVPAGTSATEYFRLYNDWVYEIGLTPNRMDAMSHYGVARDVCAWLSYHQGKNVSPKSPFTSAFPVDNNNAVINVIIENETACERYSGVSINGITVKESPEWLRNKLQAIGLRSINNIVDITNYILHETGQPLHAFDADAITGKTVRVKNVAQDTVFTTLDDKPRKLSSEDLMICNDVEGMCIAGVFGGIKSGVKDTTKNIFLESAWFNPSYIRKTSLRLNLRTDAATRFEKGVDISNTENVLKRAALLIKEIAGGEIASDLIDVYPAPKQKTRVTLKYNYLRKLSGKDYTPEAVKRILEGLAFEVVFDDAGEITLAVPYSKPDISLPADIVEEILRIDGLDNIGITGSIKLTPSVDDTEFKETLREKIAGYLTGLGFNEIVTNSITNSTYYTEEQLTTTVRMLNNLSVELNVLRPTMVETGLETILYNINRKNTFLNFFEFGKTYRVSNEVDYVESERLILYFTGNEEDHWKLKGAKTDLYKAKGVAAALSEICGLENTEFRPSTDSTSALLVYVNQQPIGIVAEVSKKKLQSFDIKQPVFYLDLDWRLLTELANKGLTYREVSKYPSVERDLAIVVPRSTTYEMLQHTIKKLNLYKLQKVQLFDIFESEKLGAGKKSLAVKFTLLDDEKTLTDKEVDGLINRIISVLEKDNGAEIRK